MHMDASPADRAIPPGMDVRDSIAAITQHHHRNTDTTTTTTAPAAKTANTSDNNTARTTVTISHLGVDVHRVYLLGRTQPNITRASEYVGGAG
jgi:hypothetical protein